MESPSILLVVEHCKFYDSHKVHILIIFYLSIATCLNDNAIPSHLQPLAAKLRGPQKDEFKNLPVNDNEGDDEGLDEEGAGADVPIVAESEEEEENEKEEGEEEGGDSSGGESSDDQEPPAKRMRRMSSDAQISQVGMNLPFGSLEDGRMLRSVSRLSRSSRASSVASTSDLLASDLLDTNFIS